ncbi:phage tail-collar fiber domain-containing protein [Rodentibacter haemolyticus]|uniref:phage tail-collar fiber domain-containing protein n=1 Tax=Rodentibacter haemolyticus TaxID=2778911 RepID=UPI001E347BBF|nr:phage tail protein [Rodentibacter haemolyticus]
MASLITPQFEHYIAEQTIAQGSVVFDEFIFANIPGLNENNLAQHLTMPTAAQIVHRQAVSQSGVINENAVVYSVTIGTEVGDFDFNFIGLINKSKNLLAVAVQTEPVKKTRNKNTQQGNSITRNILLEFSGAKALTGINVSADTWQIDFTVRLHGLDEKIRLTNRDLYGRAVFFDDGFLLTRKTGNQFTIQPGIAYVEGVRMNLSAPHNITVNKLPCSIYADVVHHCTVTGAYETEIQFLTQSKADYVDTANRQHYVQILADIDSRGNVTDRRLLSPFLGITPKDLDETTGNHADKTGHSHKLAKASTTKAGIVQLDDTWESDSREKAPTARVIKAIKSLIDSLTRSLGNYIPNSKKSNSTTSASSDTIATSQAVKTANDNANSRVSKSGDTMTGTLGFSGSTRSYRVNNHAWSKPINFNGDAVIGNEVCVIAFNNNGSLHLGGRENEEFNAQLNKEQLYVRGDVRTGLGKSLNDTVSKSGDTMTGGLVVEHATGAGAFSAQYGVHAPFFTHVGNANGRNNYYPYVKGRVTNGDGWGTAFSLGYVTPGTRNQFGTGVIHLIEDNGYERLWQFTHVGDFISPNDVKTASGKSLNNTHQINQSYVQTTTENWGGLIIERPSRNDRMLIESENNHFHFIRRNTQNGSNYYVISMPEKNGKVALLEDFTQSFSGTNGWCKLPNGLILQWGKSNGGWVNFPIAFPNACFSVTGTPGVYGNYEPYVIKDISNTKFYHQGKYTSDANNSHWIAIGR